MKFEHLIEINDPLNPLIDTLTVEQVWRGLVLRAESPKLFVPHLDECDISERTDSGFSRRLRYGELVIEDKVVLLPQLQVRYASGGAKGYQRLLAGDDHRNARRTQPVGALPV